MPASFQDRGATKDEAITSFNQSYSDGNYQEALASIKPERIEKV